MDMFDGLGSPNRTSSRAKTCSKSKGENGSGSTEIVDYFVNQLDFVPASMPKHKGLAKLIILEDNEPVIKLTIKQRWPQFKYVPRTHRIDLDWLFERFADPCIGIRYVDTKNQLADFLTKGMFTTQQFTELVRKSMLADKASPLDEHPKGKSRKHVSVVKSDHEHKKHLGMKTDAYGLLAAQHFEARKSIPLVRPGCFVASALKMSSDDAPPKDRWGNCTA